MRVGLNMNPSKCSIFETLGKLLQLKVRLFLKFVVVPGHKTSVRDLKSRSNGSEMTRGTRSTLRLQSNREQGHLVAN